MIPKATPAQAQEVQKLLELFRNEVANADQRVDSILSSGFPVDLPLVEQTGQTLLMMASENEKTKRSTITRVLMYNPKINL